jgi:hypothetical protein
MKNSTGYRKISKLFGKFGKKGSMQNAAHTLDKTQETFQATVKPIQRPRLKSAIAAGTRGDFQSNLHPAGIDFRTLTATRPDSIAARQPAQFCKNAPLSAVFTRLMNQGTATRTPTPDLRSMLGLVK